MMKKYLFLLLLGFLSLTALAQSPTADTQTQFCGDTDLPPFPNTVDGPSAAIPDEAASYGCLGTYPNPAWFYTQVDQSGSITFTMTQTSTTGAGIDVDFIAWGPFDGPPPIYGAENLNPSTQVGCSYSTASVEQFTIPNAVAGQYYVVLLTNFSNQPGTITFDQTGGTGTLNCFGCEFDPIDDFTLCNGQSRLVTPVLTSTIGTYDPAQTTYQWSVGGDASTGAGGNNIPGATSLSLNITSPGVYTITANNTYCGAGGVSETFVVSGQLPFPTSPPQPILICSPTNPPFLYDLRQNDPIILNGVSPSLYTMTYYESSANANGEIDPIPNPSAYSSAGGGELVYVRIEDTNTGCHITRSFALNSSVSPIAGTGIEPMAACDDDRNGSETFNLEERLEGILDGVDPDAVTVSYHTSEQNANANVAIQNPYQYQATGTSTIIVRVTSRENTACYSLTSFTVRVTARPLIVPPANAFICSTETYTLPFIAIGGYFTAPGGANGGGTQLAVGQELNTSQTIYIYAETGTDPNCVDENSFTLTVIPAPVADVLAPATGCETYALPALSSTDQHYYTATGGPAGTGTELAVGTAITQNTTLYIYIQSGDAATTICTDESEFVITVLEKPVAQPVTPLEACDDYDPDNGVTQVFNLVLSGDEAIGTQTGLVVSYHTTREGAENGTDAIGLPESYNTGTGIIYLRITYANAQANCPTIVELPVTVFPNPIAGTIQDIVTCDVNNSPDGQEVFDLTSRSSQASTNPADVVTFYISNADAQVGRNSIPNITSYTNRTPTEVIWVRVTSSVGCIGISSFRLIVNPLPVVNPSLTPFYECENTPGSNEADFNFTEITPVVTQGAGGYAVTYFTTQADADSGTATPLESPYTSVTATIYARLVDTRTGCISTTPVQLEVQGPPVVLPQPALNECDPNNDEVTTFNLQPTLDAIAAAVGGVTVTIHETRDDAFYFGGRNPILNTTEYTNVFAETTNGIQTLYIRVQSNQTDCFSVTTLQLIVHPVPVATEPTEPYAICDNGDNDTDGTGIFDLTSYEPEVLNTMDPTQFIVTYFTSEADAIANTNAIPNPAAYPSASTVEGQPIFIKVTNNVTGCYDIVELHLVVNALPVAVFPTAYTQCDDNNPGDEREVFDLTTKISEITAGINGVDVTFYHNMQDAQLATNAIPEADTHAYTNTRTVETLFVRVTTRETGCFRVVLMDIRVEPLPTLTPPTLDDLTLCDTDGNGEATINLQELIDGLVNNGANIDVAFYETFLNATNGVLPIQNLESYLNANPANHTVYVVATNNITGCVSAPMQLDFIVNPASIVPDLEDLEACDDRDDDAHDNLATFDLTLQDAVIRPQVGVNDTIQYFASEAAAQAGQPMIVSPATYNGHGGDVIWVRVENPITECFSITSFELKLNAPALITAPAVYVLCDEALPNDMMTTFDLTTRDTEILSPDSLGQDNVVEYFASQTDMDNNVPIANPTAYINIENGVAVNPKDIFVRVTTTNGCVSYTFLTVKVLPLPNPNPTPEPLEECDDVSGDGIATFDLTEANANILLHSTLTELKYYVLESDALAGTNPIPDFTSFDSASTTIYVRAELAGSEPGDPVCAVVVPLELIVNPLPATEIAPYGICQTNFTGYAQFDLGNYRSTILPAGAVQTDYIVRFYAIDPRVTPPGAANPTLNFRYTNTVYQQQTIWVYAQNIETECDVVLPLVLSVEPQTIANPVDDTVIRECDYDGNNDGITSVDLTEADAVIIGTQGPITDYTVTYYLTEADARADQNAITGDLTNYVTSTTILWAMVKNNTYPYGCPAYTPVPVTIDLLPAPVISSDNDSHTSCVDFETNEVLRYVELHSNITTPDNTFQWFKDGVAIAGATSADYSAYESGIYTVVVTGAAPNFCVSDAIPGWDVTMSGPASLIGDGYVVSNAFSDNQVITILVEGYGDYQYSMYVDGPWQNSNVFTNVTVGYHDIFVRDVTNGNDACDPITISDVSTIDYPKYFTPNGDGYNDYWNIIGLANFPSSRIYIFDKYGKLLKQLAPASDPTEGQGWDGTFNGNPLPSDDYWFTVTFPDGGTVREFKAHFAMKR